MNDTFRLKRTEFLVLTKQTQFSQLWKYSFKRFFRSLRFNQTFSSVTETPHDDHGAAAGIVSLTRTLDPCARTGLGYIYSIRGTLNDRSTILRYITLAGWLAVARL